MVVRNREAYVISTSLVLKRRPVRRAPGGAWRIERIRRTCTASVLFKGMVRRLPSPRPACQGRFEWLKDGRKEVGELRGGGLNMTGLALPKQLVTGSEKEKSLQRYPCHPTFGMVKESVIAS